MLQEGYDGTSPGRTRKRTGKAPAEVLSLAALTEDVPRVEAVRWFFELLVLQLRGCVELEQAGPYADIAIRRLPALATL